MISTKILPRWTGFSLKYRIAAIIFLLEAIMMATVLGVTLTYSLDENRKLLSVTEQVMLNLLGDLSRVALLTVEYDELQPYIEQVVSDPRVETVILTNQQGRVVVSNEYSYIGHPPPRLNNTEIRLWKYQEIKNASGSGLLGKLAIRFSNETLIQTNHKILNLGIRIALIGMVLIAIVGVIIGFLLTRRLDTLTTTAQKLADGNLDVKINMPGHDELSIVGHSFNHMVENVKRNIEELKSTNQASEQSRIALRELVRISSAPGLFHDERLSLLLDTGREYFNMPVAVLSSAETDKGNNCRCKVSGNSKLTPSQGPLNKRCAAQLIERNFKPLDIPNLQKKTEFEPVNLNPCWKSYLGAAVLVEGHIHCTLEFSSTEIRTHLLTKWDLELLKVMAQWISGELARQMAYDSQQRHQAEFARVSRMNTIGEMAASLAHELNQPLTGAINYSSGCLRMLREGKYDPEKLIEGMERATEGAKLAADIIRHIREFVQKDDAERTSVNLNKVINNVMPLTMLEASRYNIEIRLDLAKTLPPVQGDMIQLEQVILNFIRNGIDSMNMIKSKNHCLTITTRQRKESVLVTASDTGEGIPTEALSKIFDAFYTTKSDGMGIGLSISRSIVESHHGKIMAKSLSEGGASFSFELPITEQA